MTVNQRATALRLLRAFFLAVALAIVFGVIASAQGEDEDIYILPPDVCRHLEPWGYWWYFFNCYVPPASGGR